MPIGLTDILAALQNGVKAINELNATFAGVTGGLAGTVTSSLPAAGAVVFLSSQAAGLMEVTTSSGATYRVPVY